MSPIDVPAAVAGVIILEPVLTDSPFDVVLTCFVVFLFCEAEAVTSAFAFLFVLNY